MGVDLQTYRAKIGTFRHSIGVDVITIVCCVNFTRGLKTVGSVVFVGLLLLVAGIEPNPGPKEDELKPLNEDEVQEQIVATQRQEPHGDKDKDNFLPKAIKVTGLPDRIDKEFLVMFFEDTKRQGGGKVKEISIDIIQKSAIIEFEEPSSVAVVIGKQPTTILGIQVCIKTYDETDKDIIRPIAIKVTSLPDEIDKDTLEMIFEDTKRQGGGKVKDILLDPVQKSAIVTFEEPNAVAVVLEKQPLIILGKEVCVKAYTDDNAEETPQTSAIKVTGLPDNIDEDTLEMIFENTKKYGGGTVKMINLDRTKKTAIIEFDDLEAAEIVLGKQPIIVVGKKVKIERYCFSETHKPKKIRLKDLPDNIDEETLTMIFEDTKRHGGGTVKNVFLNKQKKTAVIEFEQSEAVETVLRKRPIKILGKPVSVDIEDDTEQKQSETTDIVVKGLPVCIDEDTLETIFEKQGEYEVKHISLDKATNVAVIAFQSPNAVNNILAKSPISVLGKVVSIEFPGSEEQTVSQPTTIIVNGLPDAMDEDTLQTIFENKKKQGGGKVKKVKLQSSTNSAVIEFEESKAVEVVLSKTPMTIMGHLVEIKVSTSDGNAAVTSNIDDTDRLKIIQQMIHSLGLDSFSSKKLSLMDVLIIDPYEDTAAKHHTYKELPLLFLKKLLSANSEALDLRLYNLDSSVKDTLSERSTSSVLAMYETQEDIQTISPLDLLLLTFQCCDSEVKQLIIQKLYLCKLAVPFIYHDFFLNKSLISMWPLRTTAIENKMKLDDKDYSMIEHEVVEMPTKFVTFGRYGRPLCSKSRFVNGILCDFNADTYFNKDCQSGLTKRYATDGYSEIFWLPTVGDEKSLFSYPMTFINLRGDITCPFLEKHQSCISSLTDVFVIFVDVSSILNSSNKLVDILNKFKIVVVIISSPLDPRDKIIRKSLENFECMMKNNTENIIHLLGTHSGRDEKNPKSFCMELTKQIVDCLTTLTKCSTDTLNSRLISCKNSFDIETD